MLPGSVASGNKSGRKCRREWQKRYGFRDKNKQPGNYLAPCSIRDHYHYFRRNILSPDIKPEDENARLSLEDPEYFKAMDDFDKKLWEITNPMWKE